MRKVLIATHFQLADGFKNALTYFGVSDQIKVINAFTEGVDHEKEIDQFFKENEGDEILAFSDIAFGSVNQYLMTYLGRDNYHLISGTNLPVLLDLLIPENEVLDEDIIAKKIEEAQKTIVYMNRFQRNTDDDDE